MSEEQRPDALFAVIGRFMIAWSWLETGLDAMQIVIRLQYAALGKTTELETALSRKLGYIETAASELKSIEQLKADVPSLVADVRAHSELRHDIVHGTASKDPTARVSAKMTLTRWVQPRKNRRAPPRSIDVDTLEEAISAIEPLADRALDIASKINQSSSAAPTAFSKRPASTAP